MSRKSKTKKETAPSTENAAAVETEIETSAEENAEADVTETTPWTEKLSEEEKVLGCVRPIRMRYLKKGSKAQAVLSRGAALEMARNPKVYPTLWCLEENKDLPIENFEWEDGTTVGE